MAKNRSQRKRAEIIVFDPGKIIEVLNRHQVRYVIVGGIAATLYGCPEQTFDLDILFADDVSNRQKLLNALHEMDAQWDEPLTDKVLQKQWVFALNTRFGDLDIFSEVLGVGKFEDALLRQVVVHIGSIPAPILDLPTLIAAKEAANDPNPRKKATLEYLKTMKDRKAH